MQTLPLSDLCRLNTLRLTPEHAEVSFCTSVAELEDHLLALPPERRRTVQIAGELSNTVLGRRIDAPLVLFRDDTGVEVRPGPDGVEVKVSGGFKLDTLAGLLCEHGVPGMELLSGIPGTLGGAVAQNVAAYGQQVSTHLQRARLLDLIDGTVSEVDARELAFAYRSSALKRVPTYAPTRIVLEATFELPAGAPPQTMTYRELATLHAERGRDPASLVERRATVLEVRDRKGMAVEGPHWVPSAGSYFLSPVVSRERARAIAATVRGAEFAESFVSWYRPEADTTRIPAALLLRAAGLMNGDRWGRVRLSPQHILAVSTLPGATGSDVRNLGGLAQERVQRALQVTLEPEVRFLGQFDDLDPEAFVAANPFEPGAGEPAWARDLGAAPA